MLHLSLTEQRQCLDVPVMAVEEVCWEMNRPSYGVRRVHVRHVIWSWSHAQQLALTCTVTQWVMLRVLLILAERTCSTGY